MSHVALPEPDAAIVDVGVSDVDGLSVLREIKAADPQSQVILMTGSATIDSAIEAIKAGALDYMTKPCDPDRLRELLVPLQGLALAPVLDRLAHDARAARRRQGESAARKLPVRLSFPLVACTLPAFVLLALAPALLGALSTLRGSAP